MQDSKKTYEDKNLDFRGRNGLNSSFNEDVNTGRYGKLNADQINERFKLHARRVATGSPTVAQIAEHWGKKYGIEMSYNSEKEWGNTHRESIDRTRDQMIYDGELLLAPVNYETISQAEFVAASTSVAITKVLKKHVVKMKDSIDWECDPLAKRNLKASDVKKMEESERDLLLADVYHEDVVNKKKMDAFFAFSKTVADLSATQAREVELTAKLADKAMLGDSKDAAKLKRRFAKVMDEIGEKANQDFEDVTSLDINDEVRERLLKEKKDG